MCLFRSLHHLKAHPYGERKRGDEAPWIKCWSNFARNYLFGIAELGLTLPLYPFNPLHHQRLLHHPSGSYLNWKRLTCGQSIGRLEVVTARRWFDENGRAAIEHIACCWFGMIDPLAHTSFLAPDQRTRSFRRPLNQAQGHEARAGVTPNRPVARANACSQAVLPARDAGASLK